MTESSRFRRWPKPTAYPFYDVITGDTSPGEVFDLGVELEGYDGSVFIKPEHIIEMGRAIGMATKEEVDAIVYENRRLQAQVNALPDRTDELKNGLASLVSEFHLSLAVASDSALNPSSVESIPEPEGTVDEESGNDGSDDSTDSGKDSTEVSDLEEFASKLSL